MNRISAIMIVHSSIVNLSPKSQRLRQFESSEDSIKQLAGSNKTRFVYDQYRIILQFADNES